MALASRVAGALLALLPGGLAIYLSFNAGGFFPGATALAAVVVALLLVVHLAQARAPLAGLAPPAAVAIAALALLAGWTLASQGWSDASGRAVIEFDRVLLYVLGLALAAVIAGGDQRLRWTVRGLAAAIVVVCGAAFISRALPDVISAEPNLHNERLSYPLTYWNALGLLAAIGLVLCTQLASSTREARAGRILAAAAAPLLAATLLLTFSRGGLGVGILALVVYAVAARPPGLPAALLAAGPPTAAATIVAYRADLLTSENPTTRAAIDQGHDLALAVVLCVVSAALLRALLLPLDSRLDRVRFPRRARRPLAATAAAAVALALVAAIALDVPGSIGDRYDQFVAGNSEAVEGGDPRARLTDPDNNGRIDLWRAALHGLDDSTASGSGAGTFPILWAANRPYSDTSNEGHSLYVEVLGELGVVGLALVLVAVLALLWGTAARIRGPDRTLGAGAFAATLAWAIHAGVDWDWEMPAVTLPVLMLAGAAIARPEPPDARPPGRVVRLVACVALLVAMVTPVRVGLSQLRLDDAVDGLRRGDCAQTVDSSLDSIDALSARAEPYELLAYCDARLGQTRLALRAVDNALERDPDNWELHYASALVHGAAGLDPRPALRRARELDPRGELGRGASKRFRGDDPKRWRRAARSAPLPLQ